ncbi:uncharacterized mitochondrial protein AtMg00810-like [Telopea speciosissima]|uniref:uncharacterized mitochondrial protein AtMg00810-like n=1 Tax=Telopea speciosissima TaxID=54955 RepID=UPI001CC677C6|nr:uncharacterized mitochondrial protein AtMg00810-like [Telopea speciosissima]
MDPYFFIFKDDHHTIYVLIYVDDILVTSNSAARVTTLLTQLSSEFTIKDLGPLSFFLGIEATYNSTCLLLFQSRYVSDLLQRAGMMDCKPSSTPMAITFISSNTGSVPFAGATKYRSIVGALQYVTLTLPDVAFTANHVCEFMHAPTEDHSGLLSNASCVI